MDQIVFITEMVIKGIPADPTFSGNIFDRYLAESFLRHQFSQAGAQRSLRNLCFWHNVRVPSPGAIPQSITKL
ncbi:MAG: hypothetical protein LUE09_14575 [Synergistaceae bacterium]|nr:hypothetical protein [Synergistaceae bacterium]